MSTTTTSPSATSSDASASPSATDSGNSNGGFSPPSSTLYLLTFLATLFVLLFVSCAIVLRSFLIRRRFRLQVQEQIAAGLLPPEALNPRRDFGEKPRLWDVNVEPAVLVHPQWEYSAPLTARIIHDSSHSSDEADIGTSPRYRRFTSRILRHRAPPAVTPASPKPSTPDPADPLSPSFLYNQEVQVAVMVAMPAQRQSSGTIPEMVIGLSTVPVRTRSS